MDLEHHQKKRRLLVDSPVLQPVQTPLYPQSAAGVLLREISEQRARVQVGSVELSSRAVAEWQTDAGRNLWK